MYIYMGDNNVVFYCMYRYCCLITFFEKPIYIELFNYLLRYIIYLEYYLGRIYLGIIEYNS
jgi:hypothetical protein